MPTYWFTQKRYGWGWTPVTWQGWALVAAYAALVVAGALLFLRDDHGARGVLAFVVWTTGYTVWLITMCWRRGPRPRWQWGPRPGHKD